MTEITQQYKQLRASTTINSKACNSYKHEKNWGK
jgi:hypothetical protein